MAESLAANNESHFHSLKTGEEESKLLKGSIPKCNRYKERSSERFHFLMLVRSQIVM